MTLTSRQTAELRRALEARRAALTEELARDASRAHDEAYAEVAGTAPDIGDQSVADLVADINQAELSRDLGELAQVEAALERIKRGSHGVCLDCGDDIAYARLQAEPAAARCVPCQGRREK
jgi:RNA polymerase-binding transcription factor DksA